MYGVIIDNLTNFISMYGVIVDSFTNFIGMERQVIDSLGGIQGFKHIGTLNGNARSEDICARSIAPL